VLSIAYQMMRRQAILTAKGSLTMAQALVCPHCRTWFEGKGKSPRCPSCRQRFHQSETSTISAGYEARSRFSHEAAPALEAATGEDLETPAFLGRSANDYSPRVGIRLFLFRLATQLGLVAGGIVGMVGLILLNLLLVIIGAALIAGALILDAVFDGDSSNLLGARWFYRYPGRE